MSGKGYAWLLAAATLVAWLPAHQVLAQVVPGATTPAPAQSEAPKDSLGRDTPRGTLLGFMRAAREGNDAAALLYLNTTQKGDAGVTLARQLYVVLDRRLPARLNELSNSPEGSLANPLRPDQDVVGVIVTADGPLEVVLERVRAGGQNPVWQFSRQTLGAIPDVFDEIDLISVDDYLPDSLGPRIGGLRVFQWLVLCLVLPLSYRLLGLTRLPGALRLLVLAVGIRWLVAFVDLPLIERQVWSVVAALLSMMGVVWLLLRANAYGERYARQYFLNSHLVETVSILRLGRRFADVLVVVVAALVALRYFGVDPTAALAGLGIGGIAVALAAQKTLENVIGGLSIIFDKAVRVGDFLRLGEAVGTVDSIGLRSTRIRTLDRTILSIPNGQVANVTLETLSVRDKCWFHHILGLRYETTSAQMRRVIDRVRERLATDPAIEAPSVRVRFLRFGPSSLDVEIFAYVLTDDWNRFLEKQEQLLLSVMEVVEGAGTAIAFPTQTLHIAEGRAGDLLAANVPLPPDSKSDPQ